MRKNKNKNKKPSTATRTANKSPVTDTNSMMLPSKQPSKQIDELKMTKCSYCSEAGILFEHLAYCGRCFKVSYCSKSCQALHWKMHQLSCVVSPFLVTLVEYFKEYDEIVTMHKHQFLIFSLFPTEYSFEQKLGLMRPLVEERLRRARPGWNPSDKPMKKSIEAKLRQKDTEQISMSASTELRRSDIPPVKDAPYFGSFFRPKVPSSDFTFSAPGSSSHSRVVSDASNSSMNTLATTPLKKQRSFSASPRFSPLLLDASPASQNAEKFVEGESYEMGASSHNEHMYMQDGDGICHNDMTILPLPTSISSCTEGMARVAENYAMIAEDPSPDNGVLQSVPATSEPEQGSITEQTKHCTTYLTIGSSDATETLVDAIVSVEAAMMGKESVNAVNTASDTEHSIANPVFLNPEAKRVNEDWNDIHTIVEELGTFNVAGLHDIAASFLTHLKAVAENSKPFTLTPVLISPHDGVHYPEAKETRASKDKDTIYAPVTESIESVSNLVDELPNSELAFAADANINLNISSAGIREQNLTQPECVSSPLDVVPELSSSSSKSALELSLLKASTGIICHIDSSDCDDIATTDDSIAEIATAGDGQDSTKANTKTVKPIEPESEIEGKISIAPSVVEENAADILEATTLDNGLAPESEIGSRECNSVPNPPVTEPLVQPHTDSVKVYFQQSFDALLPFTGKVGSKDDSTVNYGLGKDQLQNQHFIIADFKDKNRTAAEYGIDLSLPQAKHTPRQILDIYGHNNYKAIMDFICFEEDKIDNIKDYQIQNGKVRKARADMVIPIFDQTQARKAAEQKRQRVNPLALHQQEKSDPERNSICLFQPSKTEHCSLIRTSIHQCQPSDAEIELMNLIWRSPLPGNTNHALADCPDSTMVMTLDQVESEMKMSFAQSKTEVTMDLDLELAPIQVKLGVESVPLSIPDNSIPSKESESIIELVQIENPSPVENFIPSADPKPAQNNDPAELTCPSVVSQPTLAEPESKPTSAPSLASTTAFGKVKRRFNKLNQKQRKALRLQAAKEQMEVAIAQNPVPQHRSRGAVRKSMAHQVYIVDYTK